MPSTNKHVQECFDRVKRMPFTTPLPWRDLGAFGIGGLISVGFGSDDTWLLVTSHQGRGVFNSRTGERVARDAGIGDWEDPFTLSAQGIGPLEAQTVRMSGLYGGGLPRLTADHWSVEPVFYDWPSGSVILEHGPKTTVWLEERAAGCARLCDVDAVRAIGFSRSGNSLVIAESHTLHLYGRNAAA